MRKRIIKQHEKLTKKKTETEENTARNQRENM